MAWLANRLRERVQIRQPVQTENATTGGFDRSYTTLLTIWAELIPIKESAYRRQEQIKFEETHELTCRRVAVETLGFSYSKGFSTGFDSIYDFAVLKSSFYVFVQRGSTVKGRLFRIRDVKDVKERREYLEIRLEEIEEAGTGSTA